MRVNHKARLFEKELTPLQREVARLKEAGIDLIDFSSDTYNIQVPGIVRNYCKRALDKRRNTQYSLPKGEDNYREDIAKYYKDKFSVELDEEKNICASNGLKESLLRITSLILEKDDICLVPTPNRPSYKKLVLFNNAVPEFIELTEENNFLPHLDNIPEKTKILFLNYPNNPTAATATKRFYKKVYDLAQEKDFLVVCDESLADLMFEGEPISILQQGAKHMLVINDLRYRSSMRDYNIGWIAGDESIITALNNFNAKIPTFIQDTASVAISDDKHVEAIKEECKIKRNIITKALSQAGLNIRKTDATHYIWQRSPLDSADFTRKLLEKGIVVRDGSSLSETASNYVRFSLSPTIKECKEAAARIRELRL